MRYLSASVLALTFALLSGCSTTQEIVLAKANPVKRVAVVAQSLEEDNSPQMNGNLEAALQKDGITLKTTLPAGTRKSADVDAIVSYTDVWRWDLVMYLKTLNVRLYDAETGDLLVTGQWNDSVMHGFRDAKVVMAGVVGEMLAKLRAATK
jgi:hypothetical protein